MTQPARSTVINATRPTRLSKGFRLNPDGTLVAEPGGLLIDGQAEIKEIAVLDDLAHLLTTLTPGQALCHGVPREGNGRVLSRRRRDRLADAAGTTTRTRDRFSWPDGPGVMMLDYDPPDGDVALDRAGLVALLRKVAPGLRDARLLWWPSASSHIHRSADGAELRGLWGQRLYLMVADASDIPRAGAALIDRLWAAGHGRIKVSASGAALERCPLDAQVWQPERLDFAAVADCGPGLEQRRGDPEIVPGSVEVVETRSALPDDPDITASANAKRSTARADARPQIAAARAAHEEQMLARMLTAEEATDDACRASALSAIGRAVSDGVLGPDFPIEVITDAGVEVLTVATILATRERYHGRLTRDPLDPGHDGGRATGKLYLLDAHPSLHSFAHGGRTFRLTGATVGINVARGQTARATDQTLDILRTQPAVFERGGELVALSDGALYTLDEPSLAHFLASVIQFRVWRQTQGGGGWQDADPPREVLRQILSPGLQRDLKPLVAVITAPTMLDDGRILDTPGHDAESGLFLDMNDERAPRVPRKPDRAAVCTALDRLMEPFAQFPFVDAGARSALLSALLTAAVRPGLPTTPAFAFDAPVQASGKTLLASCVAQLASGTAPMILPHTAGRDDEEVRKRLFSALLGGASALVWDNVIGVVDSASLASLLTSSEFSDRVLAKSELRSVANRMLVLMTGNNLCLAGDLPRRVITCRIDPETATPFARRFERDPLRDVAANRPQMIVDALTLIQGRLNSGALWGEGRMASFEAWDDLVRQTVAWIGRDIAPSDFIDPMELVRAAQAADPELDSLHGLLGALRHRFPAMWFTSREVADIVGEAGGNMLADARDKAILEALSDVMGDARHASVKSIGRCLSFRCDRIANGLRLLSRSRAKTKEFLVDTVEEDGPGHKEGFNGFTGFSSQSSPEKLEIQYREKGKRKPSNLSKPLSAETDDPEWGAA